MPDQTPPGLEEKEPPFAADLIGGEAGTTTGEVAPGGTEVPATTTPEDEEQHFIKIDKRQWAKEIDRLEKEYPDYAQVLSSKIGNKAARSYKPQIEQLERAKAKAEQDAFKFWVQSMDEKQVTNLYNTNPDFARAYTDLVHQNPQAIQQQQQQQAEIDRITRQVENLFDWAEAKGLPSTEITKFQEALAAGKYKQGTPDEAWIKFQTDVHDALLEHLTPKQQAQAGNPPATATNGASATPPPAANPNLLSGSANTGQAAARNPGVKYTRAQIESMQASNPQKFLQLFPGDTDFEDAIKRGEIEGYEYSNPYRS